MKGADRMCCGVFVRVFPRLWISSALATVAGLAVTQQASAQALNGSVVGSVRDSSQAVVADASVVLTNTETKTSRSATTNASGDFDFATVQPGTYEVRVTRTGFSAFVRTGVAVTPDKITRVDAVLNVGNVSETVTVAANAVIL